MNRYILYLTVCLLGLGACSLQGMKNKIAMKQADQAMVNRDFAAAAQAYSTPAQSAGEHGEPGNPIARYWLATFLFHGTGMPMDRAAAMQWMHLAAEAEYPPAQLALGLWYLSGQTGTLNPELGTQFVARAAEHNHPEAVLILGALTAQGVGVSADTAQALHLFGKAHSLGYPVPGELLTPQGVSRMAATK